VHAGKTAVADVARMDHCLLLRVKAQAQGSSCEMAALLQHTVNGPIFAAPSSRLAPETVERRRSREDPTQGDLFAGGGLENGEAARIETHGSGPDLVV
jgi:hypothetical protein